MSVTILAVIFIVVMLAVAYFGFRYVIKPRSPQGAAESDRCTICRALFPKETLIERTIGDSHVYRFCGQCIRNLHNDLLSRN